MRRCSPGLAQRRLTEYRTGQRKYSTVQYTVSLPSPKSRQFVGQLPGTTAANPPPPLPFTLYPFRLETPNASPSLLEAHIMVHETEDIPPAPSSHLQYCTDPYRPPWVSPPHTASSTWIQVASLRLPDLGHCSGPLVWKASARGHLLPLPDPQARKKNVALRKVLAHAL